MNEPYKRRSRMSRTAVGKRLELTPRDLALFELLSRYRYLRSNFLYAFLGGASEKRFKERLGHLYHDGRYIDRPPQQWQFANSRYMPAVYELDEAGERVLRESGRSTEAGTFPAGRRGRPSLQFGHTLMIAEILASIELGVRADRSLRFISAREILAKAPPRARAADGPFEMPVSISYTSPRTKEAQRAEVGIVPDALFGLEYDRKSYRFFALEADRNTMPVTRSDLRQTSYLRKILAYRAVAAQLLHRSLLGLPNLLVLNVMTDEAHMRNVMAVVKELTGGSTMFLFKSMAGLGDLLHTPSPTPALLFEPWQRVEHEPLSIAR